MKLKHLAIIAVAVISPAISFDIAIRYYHYLIERWEIYHEGAALLALFAWFFGIALGAGAIGWLRKWWGDV